MRSSSRSKLSLKISHTNNKSATFEMAYKIQKSKKSNFFTTSTYSILASTIKISTKNFLFNPPSKVSKIAKGYVYINKSCVYMRVEGPWGMASCGSEE